MSDSIMYSSEFVAAIRPLQKLLSEIISEQAMTRAEIEGITLIPEEYARQTRIAQFLVMHKVRQCSKCGEIKPLKEFGRKKNPCKKCAAKATREYRKTEKYKARPHSCKCGEKDRNMFYDSHKSQCKKCHQKGIKRLPQELKIRGYMGRFVRGRQDQYDRAFTDQYKNNPEFREEFLRKQRIRRTQGRRGLLSRLNREAKKIIGVSKNEITEGQMRTILYVRLFKLVKGGVISHKSGQEIIKKFNEDKFETLLTLFEYDIPRGKLGGSHGNIRW